MKITISTNGEIAVGIPSHHITIDWNIDLRSDTNNEIRKELREKLSKVFAELCDEKVYLSFDDECADCCRVLKNSVCKNKSCVSYNQKVKGGDK